MRKYKTINQVLKMFTGGGTNTVVRRFCGELLGSGVYRDVYVLKQNPKYVVKIVKTRMLANFPNVSEWRNYIDNKHSAVGKWLAPLEFINLSGSIMVQQRANWEGKEKSDYPKKLPYQLADHKYTNYGWIGEQFVCFDYTFLHFPSKGKRTRNVRWRSATYKGTKTPATLKDQIKIW